MWQLTHLEKAVLLQEIYRKCRGKEPHMELYDYERKHLQMLRPFLPECMVLLKCNQDFPLDKPGKIALYGSGARNTTKGGTGSGEVNSRFAINVEDGLEQEGFTITTKHWLDAYDRVRKQAKKRFIREVKQRARQKHTYAPVEGMGAVMPEPEYHFPIDGEGDTAIYVLSRISGEGSDRKLVAGDVYLSDTEKRDILECCHMYRKFMLVLNVGGPVDLSAIKEVENVLILSQLGVETGAALARVLLGRDNPSGKLTTTWAKVEDYCQEGTFGEWDDTEYKEGIYVGYRYFDTARKKAEFPFGFGMSYTDFDIKADTFSAAGRQVTVDAVVCNIGAYAGKEVVQMYVSIPQGKLDQPYQVLAAFAKTRELKPGEKQSLSITFDMNRLASYDEEAHAYILEKGSYVVRIGNDSVRTEVCGIYGMEEDVIVSRKPDENGIEPVKLHPKVLKMTEEELAYMNVGAFSEEGGIANIIGNSSLTVAGAGGESSHRNMDKGVPVLVMADGPAGLRLSQRFFRDEKGVHSMGSIIPDFVEDYLPRPLVWFMEKTAPKPKRGTRVEEQYATAIPIGTAIAQSFNLSFAEICGDIVGTEMKRFGIHLWLAPALNIHRNILCGRNFEYYSEDPIVSGMFAAAVTRGVQKHPGCGVTIKHYAANNQETNRYNNNSIVSERALRDIYLKGFEICVREAQPRAVMTSYNLINGTHTSEDKCLIDDILRKEFGFRGIVMTDWVTSGDALSKRTKYPVPNAAKVAAAGGDLFMPGSKKEIEQILSGLQEGTVTEEQLRINASRVVQMAEELVYQEVKAVQTGRKKNKTR